MVNLVIYIVFNIPFPSVSQGVQNKSGKMLLNYFTFKTHLSSDNLAPEDLSASTMSKRRVIDENVKSVFLSIFHILLHSSRLSLRLSVIPSFFFLMEDLNFQWKDLCEILYGHFHENGPREVEFGERQIFEALDKKTEVIL